MTKQLENLFNIAPVEESQEPPQAQFEASALEVLQDAETALDKIDEALPAVRALESTDAELDELATLAKDKFNDLIDLGMNVEPRLSGTIFQSATTLLGHAITAKQAKIDKKLRIIQLQIQKARLDQAAKKQENTEDEPQEISAKATVVDRNSLLNAILEQARNQKEK